VTKSESHTALSAAVQALDEELARFDQLAQAARRVPLTSERNLEKAARAINDAAESQKRVTEHIQRLIEAISVAREKHDATASELVQTRDLVQARGEHYQAQLGRFAQLGKEAGEISAGVKALGELKGRPNGEVVAELTSVEERMTRVVDGAAALARETRGEAMEELSGQCDALKQQVQAALNKVRLLREKLSATMS
jgi:methyl-accepting chemotaxis protein